VQAFGQGLVTSFKSGAARHRLKLGVRPSQFPDVRVRTSEIGSGRRTE